MGSKNESGIDLRENRFVRGADSIHQMRQDERTSRLFPGMTSEASRKIRTPRPRTERRLFDRALISRWAWISLVLMILAISVGLWYFAFRTVEDPEAIWRAGEAHLKAERVDQAEAAANRLAQLREPTPLDCMLRAQIDIARGRDDEAVAALTQVPDEDPMAAQSQLLAGQVELRRHRARFAEQYLRKAIHLDPRLEKAHRELIYILGFQLRRPELNSEFLALLSSQS